MGAMCIALFRDDKPEPTYVVEIKDHEHPFLVLAYDALMKRYIATHYLDNGTLTNTMLSQYDECDHAYLPETLERLVDETVVPVTDEVFAVAEAIVKGRRAFREKVAALDKTPKQEPRTTGDQPKRKVDHRKIYDHYL